MANETSAPTRFAAVAVDAVCFRIIAKQLHVLLGKVHLPPHYNNRWGLIGGLVLSHETAEEALKRQLVSKTGIDRMYTEQLSTFSGIKRDPRNRVISVAYLGLVQENETETHGSVETQWCSIDDVPSLAYDHTEIFKTALERLRNRLSYTNIARYFVSHEFTLSELQGVYEATLGRKLDKRNFRKRLLALKLVKATGKIRKGIAQRPAALFKFTGTGLRVLELT